MASTEPIRIVDLEPGERIRDWSLIDHIADGASASVYRARFGGISDRFPDQAALRISGDLGASRTKATIAAYNQAPLSPNVLRVYDLFEWERGSASHLVFVLEEARESLADRLRSGPLTPEQTFEMVRQIGLGLDAYHGSGLVHGDVKPANIMWADGVWKLGDHAGAAPVGSDDDTSTAATIHESSPRYRPPERFDDPSRAHRSDDLWALAVVAHECVAGSPPFSSSRQQITGPYEISERMSGELREFVVSSLELDPNRRPARLASDLSFVEAGAASQSDRSEGYGWLRALVLAGLVAAGVIAAVVWRGQDAPVPTAISPLTITADEVPTFRWKAVSGATSYLLYVNQQGDEQDLGRVNRTVSAVDANCDTDSECELAPGVEFSGAFEWWVTAYQPDGDAAENPGSFVIVEPVDG